MKIDCEDHNEFSLINYHFEFLQGKRIYIPKLSAMVEILNAGRVIMHYSPYFQKAAWDKSFAWNGLVISGSINATGNTYWNGINQIITKSQAKDLLVFTKLRYYISGTLAASYSLFNNRTTLGIAISDIGKRHQETPEGNIAGPIVVTNLNLKF